MLLLGSLCELLALLLAGAAATLAGYRAARRSPHAGRALAACGVLAFCLLPISHYLLPVLFRLPQPLSFTPALIEACGFLLLGAGFFSVRHTSRGRVLLAVLAILATCFVLRDAASRLVVGRRYAALPGGAGEAHVMQGTPQTCASACAATVLRRFGIPASEGEMTVRCSTSWFGTSTFGLIRGIREAADARGIELVCEARIRVPASEVARLPSPAILTVEVERLGHAVVYLGPGRDGRTLLIGDPLQRPVQRVTFEQLERRYRFSGDVLLVRRR